MSEKLVSQRQELRGVGVSSGIGFGHARVMQTSSAGTSLFGDSRRC